jgi:hypothetical protein
MDRYCDDKSFDFESIVGKELPTLEILEKAHMWIAIFIKNISKIENPSQQLLLTVNNIIDKIKQHQKEQTNKSNILLCNIHRL